MGSGVMDNVWDIIDKYFYSANSVQVFNDIINDIEKIVITKALERSSGNRLRAAKMLGVHRNTLNNKIKKFGIDVGGFKK